MPSYGILPVTVPGAAWGWEEALKLLRQAEFQAEVLTPAIDYAENGFPISQRDIAHATGGSPTLCRSSGCWAPSFDPDSVKTWYIDGKPPVAGQIFRKVSRSRQDLAPAPASWPRRLLQGRGGEDALIAKSTALGGTMTLEDLANYKGEWVEAAASDYHGFTLNETPPPSQAWGANVMLNILEACVPKWAPGQTLASFGPRSPKYWHFLVEAKKFAYADLLRYNADPDFVKVPLAMLLSKAHAEAVCAKIDPEHASPIEVASPVDPSGDTIVLSTADAEGNMVSWVNSNYAGFGSGVTVPGYGFILHNRGALFSLAPPSPNLIAPHKRPFNTLSAGFVMRDSKPLMTILLMGGDMQAQGHAQTLVSIFDLGANLQAATDMARFHHAQIANRLELESNLYDLVGKDLAAMGHKVVSINGGPVGGFQSILFTPLPAEQQGPGGPKLNGYYRAGSDHRKDGEAVGW